MCIFLCQAVKIQILSFFFFQSLPLEPLCEPIHQTPKVDKTSASEKFKGHKNHEERKSLQPAFLWFHKFPRLQSFCRKEVRRGSLWGEQEPRRSIMYFNTIFFSFFWHFFIFGHVFLLFWYFWPNIPTNLLSIHESALHGRSHDWTIALCNEHWKLLFRARDLNIIFTQNLGQDLIELIYHLIKGNPKFPTEELEANPAKVKSVSKQFPPSVTPIEGKRRKASNSR